MKLILSALITLFGLNIALANQIDKLKTNDDVNKFLIKKVNPQWKNTAFLSNTDTVHFGRNRFFKMDINGDGNTDLIVEGSYMLAVIDAGDDKFSYHAIDRGGFAFNKYTIVKIIHQDKLPAFIVTNRPKTGTLDVTRPTKTDTLVFKFGSFVELNNKPDDLKIEKIVYSTSACFGSCPIFDITIDEKHNVTYNAKNYNERTGLFTGMLDGDTFERIVATINYIHLAKLKDSYQVNWTDDQTASLEIVYNNGSSKKISDYGMIGSFGLTNLYQQLTLLRTAVNWHKTTTYDLNKH